MYPFTAIGPALVLTIGTVLIGLVVGVFSMSTGSKVEKFGEFLIGRASICVGVGSMAASLISYLS